MSSGEDSDSDTGEPYLEAVTLKSLEGKWRHSGGEMLVCSDGIAEFESGDKHALYQVPFLCLFVKVGWWGLC